MFRFTIRELVLLTLVVAMGIGWWLDHLRQQFSLAGKHAALINAQVEAEWHFNTLSRMIESQGYGVKRGPGKAVHLRSPAGWSISQESEF